MATGCARTHGKDLCVMCVKDTNSLYSSLSLRPSVCLCLFLPLYASMCPSIHWLACVSSPQMVTQTVYCHLTLSRSPPLSRLSRHPSMSGTRRRGRGRRRTNDGSVSITHQALARVLAHPSREKKRGRSRADTRDKRHLTHKVSILCVIGAK